MLDKIIGCFSYILFFSIFHNICRTSSSYFYKNKCQKYIIIKNEVLARILIAAGISRNKFVDRHDLNKMSIIGLISYIIIEPINIYVLILNFMDLFKLGNVHFGSTYHTIAMGALVILTFVFIIAIVADKS
ncbi:hypothetical protein psyc5s11_15690 [Clostridium gelidum]|uniref:Uncharacterized protein n=1 Tax=Clostridium gelidum TaxID=704125 RepID=A0ABM7T2X1_9CLOT|nr:hypothetical protein [Clostridium gelidum]BCZ45502.1 hypothetical protein psyc5s11_15690 [Clostridium gelidum]